MGEIDRVSYEHASAARNPGSFGVSLGIADYERLFRPNREIVHRAHEHSGRGLATIAVVGHRVRTEIHTRDADSMRPKHSEQSLIYRDEVLRCEIPQPDPLLVRNYGEAETGVLKPKQAFDYSWKKLDLGWVV